MSRLTYLDSEGRGVIVEGATEVILQDAEKVGIYNCRDLFVKDTAGLSVGCDLDVHYGRLRVYCCTVDLSSGSNHLHSSQGERAVNQHDAEMAASEALEEVEGGPMP